MPLLTRIIGLSLRAHSHRFISFSARLNCDAPFDANPPSGGTPPQQTAAGAARSTFGAPRRNRENAQVVAQGVPGTVKWFSVQKGYGFITRQDTSEDVFVHFSSVANKNPQHFMRSLDEGEAVQFDVIQGEKGHEAFRVTGPNGAPVRGSPWAEMPMNRPNLGGNFQPRQQFGGGFGGGYGGSQGGFGGQPGGFGSGGGGFGGGQGGGFGPQGGGGFGGQGGGFGGPSGGFGSQGSGYGGGFGGGQAGGFGGGQGRGGGRSEGGFGGGRRPPPSGGDDYF